jgi:murein DD-endopeptidase MepM/ murein hydrolase activator NlpD
MGRTGRRRALLALALALSVATALVVTPPSGASSTSNNPLLDALTTTTAKKRPATTTTSTIAPSGDQLGKSSSPAPKGAQDIGGDGATPKGGIPVPPEAQKIIDAVHRTPASNDASLVAAVRQLVSLGMTEDEAFRVGMGRFPVAGEVHYSDDWLYPRWGPGFRFHLGCDVFAARGTPVRAPVDGIAQTKQDTLGGLTVKVIMPDKTFFYLAHLSGLVEGFTQDMPVKTGDIVGYVGNSGDAAGGATHVHVGVYPKGGPPIDPKPILDQFLADATARLPDVVTAYQAAHPTLAPLAIFPMAVTAEQRLLRPTLATALLHPVAAGGDGLTPAALYLLANDPVGGGRQLLQDALDTLVASIDWDRR